MASIGDVTDAVTCSICLEFYEKPKCLPCLHTFCLTCLQGHWKDKSPGDEVQCPLCREKSKIPSKGLDELKNNFLLQSLADSSRASINVTQPAAAVPCEVCAEESGDHATDIPVSTVYCVDCQQTLCEQCSRPHRRWKGGPHTVIPVSERPVAVGQRVTKTFCDKHLNKCVELYCATCKENICLVCSATGHDQHKRQEISKAADEFARKIDAISAGPLSSRTLEIRKSISDLGELSDRFVKESKNIETAVRQKGEEIKLLVDRQVNSLLEELESVRHKTCKEVDSCKERLEMVVMGMESLNAYWMELKSKGKPSDVTRVGNELNTRATELLETDIAVHCVVPQVEFLPINLDKLQVIGHLSTGSKSDEPPDKSSFVYMLPAYVDLLTRCMADQLKQIERSLVDCGGSLSSSRDQQNPGFILAGSEKLTETAAEQLNVLANNVIPYDHEIDRPGVPEYLFGSHGAAVLRTAELKHRVAFELENGKDESGATKADVLQAKFKRQISKDKIVRLFVTDITKHAVDAIVTLSASNLQNYEGVAKVICDAAGQDIVDKSRMHYKENGELLCGQTYLSSAGHLPSKYLIYAVGPRWRRKQQKEIDFLYETITQALIDADNSLCRSVSISARAADIYGFPVDVAMETILSAVCDFFSSQCCATLHEVHIVDTDEELITKSGKQLMSMNLVRESLNSTHPRHRSRQQGSSPSLDLPGAVGFSKVQDEQLVIVPHMKKCVVHIYSLSRADLDGFIGDVEKMIMDYLIDKVLDSPQDQDFISRLTEDQIARIHKIETVTPVKITLEKSYRMNRIRIRGSPKHVSTVADEIHKIFKDAKHQEYAQAQWEYMDTGDFEKYPDEINVIIENDYRQKKPFAIWEENNAQYKVTFSSMEEEKIGDATSRIKVRRTIV